MVQQALGFMMRGLWFEGVGGLRSFGVWAGLGLEDEGLEGLKGAAGLRVF